MIHFNSARIILDFKMESLNLIKKLSCEICDKNFLTNNYKALHISTVHEGQISNVSLVENPSLN